MSLQDMKVEDETEDSLVHNKYGYGLQLHLNEDHLKKLGFSQPLEPGTQVKIDAIGIVESASSSVRLDEDGRGMHMGVQITQLGLEEDEKVQNAAEVLYNKKET